MDQLVKACADFMLDALIVEATNGLTGAKVGLFTNSPDFASVLATASLTEPTFTGYAQATPASWVKITDSDGGRAAAAAAPVTITPTVQADLPVVVNGAFITDSTGLLLHVAKFTTPITLTRANQPMHCTPKVPLHFQGDYAYEAGLV